MENGGHATTGFAAGALVPLLAAQLGAEVPPLAFLGYAAAGSGFALLPDWDHDKSVMTTSGGPVTAFLGEMFQACARAVYRATAREHDPPGNGEHRGLLHTPVFAALVGGLLALFGTVPWVGPVVLCLVLSPAIRALALEIHHGSRIRVAWMARHRWGAVCLSVTFTATLTGLGGPHLFGPLFGAVAAAGILTHDAGDSPTHYGVPWKALIPHRCDRCRRRRPKPARRCAMWDRSHIVPRVARFSVGTPRGRRIERRISRVALVSGLLMIGWGAWPAVRPLADAVVGPLVALL